RAQPTPEDILGIALDLAQILGQVHGRRVIHKDIKPDNVIIQPDTKAVRLIDFSIATLLPRENQETQRFTALEGTLSYMSPEQPGRVNQWIDYRADYYSLGVMLYELSTMQPPFQSQDPMELIHCHIARRPVPPAEINPAVPRALSDIIMKLMEKAAEAR